MGIFFYILKLNEKFEMNYGEYFDQVKKAKKYTATTSKNQQQQGAFCTAV